MIWHFSPYREKRTDSARAWENRMKAAWYLSSIADLPAGLCRIVTENLLRTLLQDPESPLDVLLFLHDRLRRLRVEEAAIRLSD